MKTSEIIELLEDRNSWSRFEEKHHAALYRFNNRNDGIHTSSDIGLKFDSTIVVERQHVDLMSKLEAEKLWQLSNLVALCGFEFSSEDIEDHFYTMCERADNV